MKFRDLKFPKELAKKKKLSLFKCYILEPLKKGAPLRTINLNVDRERYALTEQLAVQYALNQLGVDEALKLIFGSSDLTQEGELNRESFFVIFEVVLKNGVMEEEILLPAKPGSRENLDPKYDPEDGLLTASIRDRYDGMHIKNYTLHDIYVSVEQDRLHIENLKMDEVVINSALTGGK